MDKENNLFEEYLKSARDLILERVSSPFIFSFVISWLISNYKIVMVILTDQTDYYLLEYKIWLVNEYINYCNCLVYPLIGATLYTFVYPFADRKITTFTLNRKLEKRQAIHAIEKTELKTVEEVEAIHRRHFEVEQNLKNQIAQARATEEQLRAIISSKDTPKKETNPKASNSASSVNSKPVNKYKLNKVDALVITCIGNALNNGTKTITESEINNKLRKLNVSNSELNLSLLKLREETYIRNDYGKYQLLRKGLESYNSITSIMAEDKT